MPLQGKTPFKRKTPKGVAHLDQELFFCKTTNEVFTNYEELFERAIQCSSLVWTCGLTGRGGLTFQEACESEIRARKTLQAIPWQVKRLVLQQVSKCKASRLQDLNDKVFALIQNRYAVGENVEVVFHGVKKTCEITEVRTPGSSLKNKSPAKKSNESPKKASPSKLRYEVCEKDSDVQVLHVVAPDNLSRPKGALSKDKCKLLLKQSVRTEEGVLKVKNSLTQKYQLNSELNVHSPSKKVKADKPSKVVSPLKAPKPAKPTTPGKPNSVKSALKNSQSPSKLKKTLKSIDADIRKMFPKKQGKISQQSKENNPICPVDVKVVNDLKIEEERKRKEDLKEKKKTEAKLLHDYVLEWKKRRDDLECDDLKDLPLGTPINCGIPRDSFGEAMAIMEFLHQFSSVLQVKNTFPGGFKLELMEKALTNTDIQGPFSDLLQLFLLAVFKQQDSEEEEPDNTKNSEGQGDNITDKNSAIIAANAAAMWSSHYLGCKIRRFPLDPFTLTELLRLHLLSSGADITTVASDRGNFKNLEDPGLIFKMDNPEILKKLGTTSVFLLFPEERLKILTVLTEQLLTYPTFREILDKGQESLRKTRIELLKLYKDRKKHLKKTEPSNINEKENMADPEAISLNPEKADLPELLQPKNPGVMTEEEKEELQQFERKVKDLKNTICKIQSSFRVEPIGSDRAHRNFWLFNSIDGLFVEDANPYSGQCLQKPTPTQLTVNGLFSQEEMPVSFMHKFLNIINNSHDKENNFPKLNKQTVNGSHKKLLSNVNGLTQLKSEGRENGEKKMGRLVFGMCLANPAKCLVHGPNPDRVTWSFIHDEKVLDGLVNGLNSRGHREYNLKRSLLQEKVRIKESLVKCPITKLNILESVSEEEEVVDQRKSARLQGEKAQFAGMHPEEVLESTLRDAILDNEDKIWSGGLGAIKVKDRDAWRTAIENNSYDAQCDEPMDTEVTFLNPGALDSSEVCSSQVAQQDSDQVPSTSSSPAPQAWTSPNIKNLARALIQVAGCVQTRYISEPLASGAEYKRQLDRAEAEIERRKQKDQEENVGPQKVSKPVRMPKSPMDRWRESVMKCTSLSQLFLHLITLENSITWHRSALKASCKICRKKGDADKMLLCDKCDRGFHMYCLKPPLKEIPEGNWYCISCTPETKPENENKQMTRRNLNYKEASSDEDEDEEEEEEDEEEENEDNVQESDASSDEDDYKPKTKKAKTIKTPVKRCSSCRKEGQLVSCATCSNSFHLTCTKPALRRLPRGRWHCQKCLKKGTSNQNVESSNGTRSSTRKQGPEPSESLKRSTSNSRYARSEALLDVSACEQILESLSKHPDSWPFVGGKKKADYKRIVKRPVDLSSIRGKLNSMNYSSNNQFVADVYLMFQNCELFNSFKSDEHESSKRLSRFFQTLLRRYKIKDVNEGGDLSNKRPKRSF